MLFVATEGESYTAKQPETSRHGFQSWSADRLVEAIYKGYEVGPECSQKVNQYAFLMWPKWLQWPDQPIPLAHGILYAGFMSLGTKASYNKVQEW